MSANNSGSLFTAVANGDTFYQWLTKTNNSLAALREVVVTTNANTSLGDSVANGDIDIRGKVTAQTQIASVGIRGGNSGTSNTLNILSATLLASNTLTVNLSSNVAFVNSSVNFVSSNINLGTASTVKLLGAASARQVLAANGIAGNLEFITVAFSDLSGTANSSQIGAVAVTNSALANNSVITRTIVDDNVTTAKIANSAITTAKLADGSVTAAKLDGVSVPSLASNNTWTGNATFNGVLNAYNGNSNFDSGTLFVDSVNNRIGVNNTGPTVALTVTGAASISTTTTVGGNVTISGASHSVAGNVLFDTTTLIVDATNDRVGVGVTPTVAFQTAGLTNLVTGLAAANAEVKIASGRSANGYARLDLVGDSTYTTYGVRLERANTGANANSTLSHLGTGSLVIQAANAGNVIIQSNGQTTFTSETNGAITVAGNMLVSGYVKFNPANTAVGNNYVGNNAIGNRTIANTTPSGGADGDIWYQVA